MINKIKKISIDIEVRKCGCCDNYMIPNYDNNYIESLFSNNNKIEDQMKINNLVFSSNSMVDHSIICKDCENSGKSTFYCRICGEKRSSVDFHDIIVGDEKVCTHCYSTLTAKEYDDKISIIEKNTYL